MRAPRRCGCRLTPPCRVGDARTRLMSPYNLRCSRTSRATPGRTHMQERIARHFAPVFTVLLFALLSAACFARQPAPPDPRDAALLAKMTLAEKVNQLMLLSKGTMTGPDSAGRPNKSGEELAREGIGFQMSAFEWSAADINHLQRIALKESRLGIPVVFATDIVHGYWTVFPVPLGIAATFDPEDARVMARISGLGAIRTVSA